MLISINTRLIRSPVSSLSSHLVVGDKFTLGNILTKGFEEIWKGKAYKELRRLLIRTERSVGSGITDKEFKILKGDDIGRFSACSSCLWRWSLAC